jgi:hypothetical protein
MKPPLFFVVERQGFRQIFQFSRHRRVERFFRFLREWAK